MDTPMGIVTREPSAVNNIIGPTQEQQDLIKRTVAVGATDDELRLFLYTAHRTGLDPLARQIHFIKRSKNVKNPDGTWRKEEVGSIQTGIDGFRVVAERSGKYAGQGKVEYGPTITFLGHQAPEWAEIEVYRKDCEYSIPARAYFREYAQTYNKNYVDQLGPMWARMPYLMIAKCAEALALRKAFPQDLSGLYTIEEMAQSEEATPVKAAPIPAKLKAPAATPAAQPAPAVKPPAPQPPTPPVKPATPPAPLACTACAEIITPKVAEYSQKEFGKPLCFNCQRNVRNQKANPIGITAPR